MTKDTQVIETEEFGPVLPIEALLRWIEAELDLWLTGKDETYVGSPEACRGAVAALVEGRAWVRDGCPDRREG